MAENAGERLENFHINANGKKMRFCVFWGLRKRGNGNALFHWMSVSGTRIVFKIFETALKMHARTTLNASLGPQAIDHVFWPTFGIVFTKYLTTCA